MNVAPCPGPRSAPHGAAVHLDQVADDREAEAETALGARARRVGLPEALEDVRQEGGLDAAARCR